MLSLISPELVRLLQTEREREMAEERLASLLRSARLRCQTAVRGSSRLARALRLRPAASRICCVC